MKDNELTTEEIARRTAVPVPDDQTEIQFTEAHRDVEGLEMGVLSDGTPYLSSRGLARICDVAPGVILDLNRDWAEQSTKPRGVTIADYCRANGFEPNRLSVRTEVDGKPVNAHPDAVCMAVLEYYAFDVGKEGARKAFRMMARQTLREFIYRAVGYQNPQEKALELHNEMVVMNISPPGYFSVFQQSAKMILTSIRAGVPIGSHTIPDISVGKHWSKHWQELDLEERYGQRIKHPHYYPESYPQARAYPEAWVYPNEAMGDFQGWMENTYLPQKFPTYLERKAKRDGVDPTAIEHLLRQTFGELGLEYQPKKIESAS